MQLKLTVELVGETVQAATLFDLDPILARLQASKHQPETMEEQRKIIAGAITHDIRLELNDALEVMLIRWEEHKRQFEALVHLLSVDRLREKKS